MGFPVTYGTIYIRPNVHTYLMFVNKRKKMINIEIMSLKVKTRQIERKYIYIYNYSDSFIKSYQVQIVFA